MAIEDNLGCIRRGDTAIGQVAQSYFQSLFTSTRTDTENYTEAFINFPVRVTTNMNDDLTKAVYEEEIKAAVFDIGADPAPGPDGMTGAFYHQFWDEIKSRILEEVHQFFDNSQSQRPINHTNLCLLSKIDPPRTMSDFRPISLCNMSYKIISKILVNHLKKYLSSIISETQAAFIPGRNIIDNVIIAQEMLYSLKSRKKWAKSYVKTDISKAYDRLEWQFLRDTMRYMGFNELWIGWIMECVKSVSFSILVNGVPHGFIKPERGLRQGDPLSPYLFILCNEILSHLFEQAATTKRLKGMKINSSAPTINHILFADDALFFCHAHKRSCTTIIQVLKDYEKISGQAVNLHKSAITFGSKIQDVVKTRLVTYSTFITIVAKANTSDFQKVSEEIRKRSSITSLRK